MDKKNKLQFLIDQQQIAIDELKRSMEDFKADSDLDEDNTMDPEDFSHQTIAKESQLRLKQQLNRAQSDLELLQNYSRESFDSVQAGALIRTDKEWFLAGISLGGFESGDIDIHCISSNSPAFEILKGKKVNDHFTLSETTYEIKEIA